MKTFFDYLNTPEPCLLSEAYTPIMRQKFTTKQLKEIGDYFSSKNLGIQGSEIQHYNNKEFRLRNAKENLFAICKLVDGNYVILEVQNQKNVTILVNTSPTVYTNQKDVIKDSTDIFTFSSVENVLNKRHLRRERKIFYDPLIKKHMSLTKKINDSKNSSGQYVNSLIKKLSNYGIEVEELYYYAPENKNKTLMFEYFKDSKKFKWTDIDIFTGFGSTDKTRLTVKFRTQGHSYETEQDFEECVKEVNRSQELFKLLNTIDYSKIPVKDSHI